MRKEKESCRKNRQLRLYIHIPFCISKCYYCDFFSHVPAEKEEEEYVSSLLFDIKKEAKNYKEFVVPSIFIGGGTPSILSVDLLHRIMEQLYRSFNIEEHAEISIEMNPKTVTKGKLEAYKNMGINRLSIGMQSTNNEELKALGRSHSYEDFLETYNQARAMGFQNINVDIMESLPGQTEESYYDTLEKVCSLQPEHISSYSLILEEDTKFYDWYVLQKDKYCMEKKQLPSEEEERRMYALTKKTLKHYGYIQYEISNYAKKGFCCEHNIGYWTRDNYLGFGETAASMVNNVRWKNNREEKHILSIKEQMEEFMFLGLRLKEGVAIALFADTFSKSMFDIYGSEILFLKKEKLIKQTKEGYICLTSKGMDLSNYVFEKFLQNDV